VESVGLRPPPVLGKIRLHTLNIILQHLC
jgi:hypothetical protein